MEYTWCSSLLTFKAIDARVDNDNGYHSLKDSKKWLLLSGVLYKNSIVFEMSCGKNFKNNSLCYHLLFASVQKIIYIKYPSSEKAQ